MMHELTFKDIVAIHYPEGRTLGEAWEGFYAEALTETKSDLKYQKQFFYSGANFDPKKGVDFRGPPDWQVLNDNQNVIFKVTPDKMGTDLIYWTIDELKHVVTVHIIQVKVGKQIYSINPKDVETFLNTKILDNFKNIVRPKRTTLWTFTPVKHFVTSKSISDKVEQSFHAQDVIVHLTPTEWGKRVEKYCKATGKKLFV